MPNKTPTRKKTKTPEDWISLAELSRRAGVSKAAITLWVKAQARNGIQLTRPNEKRNRGILVNAADPLVVRYIKNSAGHSVRTNTNSVSTELGNNTLRKLTFRAEKMRMENERLREKYLPTDRVVLALTKLQELNTEMFFVLPERILCRIEREYKIKLPAEQRDQAKSMIEQAVKSANEMSDRMVEEFVKKHFAPKKKKTARGK